MKSKLRVVVVGLGGIGNRHAGIYKADPLAELVGVCDVDKTRADAAAARLGVPAFYDAEKMFATLLANEPANTVMNYDRFDEKCADGGGMIVIIYHATVSDNDPVDVIPAHTAEQARDNHTF